MIPVPNSFALQYSRPSARRARFLALAGTALLALGPVASQAQNAPAAEDDSLRLEEIVVTAQRRAEKLQEAPVSVTAFTASALADQAVTNLVGIARFTPNVEISSGRADGGGSSLNAYIRGVGQQDFLFPTDPGVGLYVDDVYLARTIGGALDLSDVERLEVLRGPQGTLYGKNTVGGAIKIVTKPVVVDGDFEGSVEGITGSYQRSDVKAYVSGPIVPGVLGFKLSGAAVHRNGWGKNLTNGERLSDEGKQLARGAIRWLPSEKIDITIQGDYQRQKQKGPAGSLVNRYPSDTAPSLGLPPDVVAALGFEPTAFQLFAAMAGAPTISGLPAGLPPLAVDPTPSDKLFRFDDLYNSVIVPYWNQKLGLPAGTKFDGRWVTGKPGVSNSLDPAEDRNEVWGVSSTVDWELGENLTLKSITAYREIDAYFPRDADKSPYPVAATGNHVTQDQFSQELQLSGDAMDGRLRWVTGGYYLRENAFDDNAVELFSGLYEVLSPVLPDMYAVGPCSAGAAPDCTTNAFSFDYFPKNKIKVDTWAVFSQINYDLTPDLNLTLGGRYSEDKKLYTQDNMLQLVKDPKFGPGTPGYTGSVEPFEENGLARYVGPRELKDSWGSFTPKVGLDWKLTSDNMVYASWSKGFKGGGWSPRPTQQNNTDLAYDPEVLYTYELGSKNTLADGSIILNLAGFYSDYKDMQVTTVGSSGGGALLLLTRNIGDSVLWGFEGEVTARLAKGFDVNLAGGYLHSKWDKFNRSACAQAIYDATKGRFCDTDLSLDDKLVDAPEWTFTVGAQKSWFVDGVGLLALRGDASYRSKTWKDPYNLGGGANWQGTPDIRNALTPAQVAEGYKVTMRQLAQDAYWLANVRLSWRDPDENWEVAAAVTNLFDKTYVTNLLAAATFGIDEAYYGRPREWMLSVKYSF
ncbi:TonB-dependent receptor [Niveispirillum sp.]|uniref:TonB-dependent receptor n=1 Tax=Niveispirillum sp. TaxID=1917217 RepID=UPI001B5A4B9D|nr:TonB-dependent receptor [Niveispirillum sp.]MBP7334862.1 TonB-dependent receptor [Niveispirillum sp.]